MRFKEQIELKYETKDWFEVVKMSFEDGVISKSHFVTTLHNEGDKDLLRMQFFSLYKGNEESPVDENMCRKKIKDYLSSSVF